MSAAQPDSRGLRPARSAAGGSGERHPVVLRLAAVQRRVAAAAERAGRARSAVTLVAVSKGFGVDHVAAAWRAGQYDFGESRVQELAAKAPRLEAGLRWHFVGRLQRNKVKQVVDLASLIHSIDRIELAEAVAERARRRARVQRVLVQVNAGEDPAKGGCRPEDAPSLVAGVRGLHGIACQGLMTIPPLHADPRPTFKTLRALRDELQARFPEVRHLSMGMSDDFEVAVEEGATIVRLGEAVFGPRPLTAPAQPGGTDPE
ncbi:MAG TPA: YggS family pyridoxal phosphate-dependent enzyme [Egibacteraceae bacterium]|nr:YggS family pyridoxal phosphate-dependent enzyme [Egibacteraceae bacterium]